MSVKNTKYLFDERKTPENMVSVSQLQTFLSCKKKWEYDYIERLKPRVERSYLTIGKLCHRGMQITMQELWKHPDLTLSELTYCGILAIREMGEKYMEETPMLDEEVPDFEQMRKDAEEIFTPATRPCSILIGL